MTVIDVAEAQFEQQVIARSRSLPVVVDFWAPWCGPCRALGPVLEQAATEREGKVVLVKVDTDANPGISERYAIQSIPAVKAFRDGAVVEEFVGAQPPAAVRRFFDLLVPTEADELVSAGDEPALRRALELEPARADASLALARLLIERGEDDEALVLLANAPGDFQAAGLGARVRLGRSAAPEQAAALDAFDAGEDERSVDLLLELLPGSGEERDDLRRLLVAIFDRLGVEHPAAREGRRRLAAALY